MDISIMKSILKHIIPALLGCLFSLPVNAQNFESIQLYYSIDSFRLTNTNRQLLDSVVENYSNRRIIVDGHADYNANENSNLLTATKRANTVLRYLVDRGFPETQVIQVTGAGESNGDRRNTQQENKSNRRVDIFITKGPLVKRKLKALVVPDTQPVYKAPATKNVTEINYNKLKVGDKIALTNISFIPGTDTLLPDSYDELNNLYYTLVSNPTLKIKLEGHVCCSIYPDGFFEDTPNWILSVNRALTVKNLLTNKGISPERLSYTGFGHTKPIYEREMQPAQAQANRRVEIRIIEK